MGTSVADWNHLGETRDMKVEPTQRIVHVASFETQPSDSVARRPFRYVFIFLP